MQLQVGGVLSVNTIVCIYDVTVTIDSPICLYFAGLVPLLGIDVWEHAYYLQYKNVRLNYVEAIFDVVNWEDVSKRLAAAKSN